MVERVGTLAVVIMIQTTTEKYRKFKRNRFFPIIHLVKSESGEKTDSVKKCLSKCIVLVAKQTAVQFDLENKKVVS